MTDSKAWESWQVNAEDKAASDKLAANYQCGNVHIADGIKGPAVGNDYVDVLASQHKYNQYKLSQSIAVSNLSADRAAQDNRFMQAYQASVAAAGKGASMQDIAVLMRVYLDTQA